MTNIKILIIANSEILISEIEEVGADLGEPDCKLIKPFVVKKGINDEIFLESWNSGYTSQDTFMIQSDKIITIADPKPTILEKYQSLIK